MPKRLMLVMGLVMFASTLPAAAQVGPAANELWEAARQGDVARIRQALDKGVDVNAKARYGVTALYFAASNGRLEAVKLLMSRGADVNAVDTFYKAQPVGMAMGNGHTEVVVFLLQNGADADNALAGGVQRNLEPIVRAALAGRVTRKGLQAALGLAEKAKRDAFTPLIKVALERLPAEAPAPAPSAFAVPPTALPKYAATYRDASGANAATVVVQDGALVLESPGQPPARLVASAPDVFRLAQPETTVTFNGRAGLVESVTIVRGTSTLTLPRVIAEDTPAPATTASTATTPARLASPRNWPSFRGDNGSGNGDGQRAVTEWDVATGRNIKWKTPIPGIATSSPIVWGNRIFTTTAITKGGDTTFRTGLYGDVKPVDDSSEHEWKIYSVDKTTGRVLWEKTAHVGVPKTKRHTKSSQASSTPVTDGRRVVALFGSAGLLVAWDFGGKELWRVDLGTLDSGWFFDPAFQWGHSSSPIIHRNLVIVQADMQKGSYLRAWDVATGKQVWQSDRPDEISTWGTPAIARGADGKDVIVTNGTKIRGYEPATGQLLWTLGPNSEITIGTPVVSGDLVFVTGGYPPVRPVYAIKPGARGDISLPEGQASSEAVVWSNMTEGTYIPTPIVYNGMLVTLGINGVMTGYDAATGKRAFRGRIGGGGAFSASPVAADGHFYVASEDGEIHVVTAAPGLAPVAKNDMKEVIMATPAIADGLIVVRTLGHLYGIGQ